MLRLLFFVEFGLVDNESKQNTEAHSGRLFFFLFLNQT